MDDLGDKKWHIQSDTIVFLAMCSKDLRQIDFCVPYHLMNEMEIEVLEQGTLCQSCLKEFLLYRFNNVSCDDKTKWMDQLFSMEGE